MYLKLYERRTTTNLINGLGLRENNCAHCKSENSVVQLGQLILNMHGLKDDRGHLMMEQPVSCTKCGKKWVDVFCRVYPDDQM